MALQIGTHVTYFLRGDRLFYGIVVRNILNPDYETEVQVSWYRPNLYTGFYAEHELIPIRIPTAD